MTPNFTALQLDALRELANIASGSAATALSTMLGREVDLNVPRALVLSLADAVDACGDPETETTGVAIGVEGDLDAVVLMLIPPIESRNLCTMLGVEAGTEVGDSALQEIGNIVGSSYLKGLGVMTGLELLPTPPSLRVDMLGALVASLLAATSGESDLALVLDSELEVANAPCALSFMLLPTVETISSLLVPLGLAESPA